MLLVRNTSTTVPMTFNLDAALERVREQDRNAPRGKIVYTWDDEPTFSDNDPTEEWKHEVTRIV